MNHYFRIFTIYILLIISILSAKAQDVSSIDFGNIESLMTDVSSNLFYKSLLQTYKDDQKIVELMDLEYHCLYYGFTFRDAYQPYNFGKETRLLQKKMGEQAYEAALAIAKPLFEKDPFNLNLLAKIATCYAAESQTDVAQIWHTRYGQILQTILASGDGLSRETAFVVNSGSDEKEILHFLQLEIVGQALEDYYEVFTVAQPNEKGIEKIYFCIKKPMEKLEELVGE